MVMVMELEMGNESDSVEFIWPFFQIAHFRPTPQSVVTPSTYPFLQICKPFSLIISSPLSHTLLLPGPNDGAL